MALVLCTNWCTTICIACPIVCEIECNEFVCNKFVLILVQNDLIQFENSNCIRSICTKFDTNLLHTDKDPRKSELLLGYLGLRTLYRNTPPTLAHVVDICKWRERDEGRRPRNQKSTA